MTDRDVDRLTRFVDPFIGSDPGGNCLCGPYLPYSLVRLGPDTLAPQPEHGYDSRQPTVRFSHTHGNGVGGSRYGNVGIIPFTGRPRLNLAPYERAEEQAAAGYYGVILQPDGIRAELTSTPRCGVHRYTFPGGKNANILIDLGAVIQTVSEMPGFGTGVSTGGFLEWISEQEVIGRGDFRGGWGHEHPYSVYFFARFDQPAIDRYVARKQNIVPKSVNAAGTSRYGGRPGYAVDGAGCKAVACFGAVPMVGLTVGISFVSIAKARASVEREVGKNSFEHVRAAASHTWDEALAPIRVEGGSAEQKRLFYSLFTRLVSMPTDLGIDDENPYWNSGIRHYTDFFCLWDSARNANSLLGLFDPERQVSLLNCLLDVADHTGWLPEAWIAGHSAFKPGGSSADVLFCEAALKGFTGIDYARALRYMRKNNEALSPDPSVYGRFLPDYHDLGYLSTNVAYNCVSLHLEYSYQDWCIGTLAGILGDRATEAEYVESSRKVWNLWREDIRFFAPRKPDGRWVEPFDPAYALPDCWNDPYFFEGSSWQWSFSVHHDFAGLIARHGGPEAFVAHLDRFMEGHYRFGAGGDFSHYYPKEFMLHVPYLYIYAGRPDRTAERVRDCLRHYFHATREGLPDNEDMGCQSAFYMCSAIGLYPIMGQDLYLLTTPVFSRTAITLGASGHQLIVESPDADPARPYIVSALLNGQPLHRAWLRHSEIAGGAVLRFEVAATPRGWGFDMPPPSPLSTARSAGP